jgi:hypothetical protein
MVAFPILFNFIDTQEKLIDKTFLKNLSVLLLELFVQISLIPRGVPVQKTNRTVVVLLGYGDKNSAPTMQARIWIVQSTSCTNPLFLSLRQSLQR